MPLGTDGTIFERYGGFAEVSRERGTVDVKGFGPQALYYLEGELGGRRR